MTPATRRNKKITEIMILKAATNTTPEIKATIRPSLLLLSKACSANLKLEAPSSNHSPLFFCRTRSNKSLIITK